MRNEEKIIDCPLYKRLISRGECFDVHGVTHYGDPAFLIPKEIRETKNFKEICLNCKNHRWD